MIDQGRCKDYCEEMVRTQEPPPSRLIMSVISSSRDALADALVPLERRFGRVLGETDEFPCGRADDYREEMGAGVSRRLFAFEPLVARGGLAAIKLSCLRIEARFGDRVDDFLFRTVNLDPGLLTPENLVLAYGVDRAHRIYLGQGVFAETALIFTRGRFTRLPWTDPDLCHPEAIAFFERVRGEFDLIAQL